MRYDTHTMARDCGKIHSPGLASRKVDGAKAAPKEVAFSVCAYPYLYDFDTVYALDGFVPPVSVDAGLLSPVYRPFLFLARQNRTSNNLFSQRRFAMTEQLNTTPVPALISIPFYGDTIYTLEYEGEYYTPIKPIVENLGIDWSSQATKLRNNKKRWATVVINTIVGKDQKNRDMVFIPIRKVLGFLSTINPQRVANKVRPKLVQYQNECDEVLYNYWSKGKSINPRYRAETKTNPPEAKSLSDEQIQKVNEELLSHMKCWNPDNHKRGLEAFYRNIEAHFQVNAIDEIPQDSFDTIIQFIRDQYHHPERHGVVGDILNHCPNIIDDLIQFVLYRVNAILEDLAKVHNETARHNITIELTMITSALGAAFPEEMQWLRFGKRREEQNKSALAGAATPDKGICNNHLTERGEQHVR